MKQIHTSEWVSLGHPDKIADYISEYILDRYLEIDPETRYAVEVQIKDNFVSIAGEVRSRANFGNKQIIKFAKEAVNKIGYTKEYQKKFGKECTICGDDIEGVVHIGQQSGDISQGVDKDAWGDQGIFFGFFCDETESGHGLDYEIAKYLGDKLYQKALYDEHLPIGLDIKTQVTVERSSSYDDYVVTDIIVAIPTVPGTDKTKIKRIVRNTIKELYPEYLKCNLIINGTGDYHIHGPIGDSGTTGRKLAVDFYGSRSNVGGGSPWTKDGSKADLTLNIFAHECAAVLFKDEQRLGTNPYCVRTELACCIGRQEVLIVSKVYDHEEVLIDTYVNKKKIKPSFLSNYFNLKSPIFGLLCRHGLFEKTKKDLEN